MLSIIKSEWPEVAKVTGISGFSLSFITLSHVEVALKIAIAIATLVYLIFKIIGAVIKKKHDEIEMTRVEMDLCAACRRGYPPLHCPLPKNERPSDCPRPNT